MASLRPRRVLSAFARGCRYSSRRTPQTSDLNLPCSALAPQLDLHAQFPGIGTSESFPAQGAPFSHITLTPHSQAAGCLVPSTAQGLTSSLQRSFSGRGSDMCQHVRALHAVRDSSEQSARGLVNASGEEDCMQYEASKQVVRPLYRSLLHAVRELHSEFVRFGSKDLLTATELAWLQDKVPGAVGVMRRGDREALEEFVSQCFREPLHSEGERELTQVKQELGCRVDCAFQALSLITKRVGLLRQHACEPCSESVTHGVRVTANSWFSTAERRLGSVFHYRISLRNESNPEAVQLINRHWFITDYQGNTQQVIGPGVLGQQPVLEPGEEFEYSSFTPLMSKRGTQQGTYSMMGVKSQSVFDVKIAPFALITP